MKFKTVRKLLLICVFFVAFALIILHFTSTSSAQETLPGDASGDGKVNGEDLTIWITHYGQYTNNGYADADFNLDGKVSGIDFVIWLNNYKKSLPTPFPTSTTTPAPNPTATLAPTVPPSPTETPTPTPIPYTELKLLPVDDAYVVNTTSSDNFGNSLELVVGPKPNILAYMKFDLYSLDTSRILSAKLRIKVTNSSSTVNSVRYVPDTTWNEAKLTYGNRPLSTYTVVDIEKADEGTWIEADLTDLALSSNGGLFSISVEPQGADDLKFYSKESSADKPYLLVNYQINPLQ